MLLRMLGRAYCGRAHLLIRAASTSVAVEANMKHVAYVRHKPDADNLTISLVLGGRQRNLNRPVDEPLEKPITRIKANLTPAKADKRAKKKKLNAAEPQQQPQQQQQQQQQDELFVGLYRDAAATELIDLSTPNGQAWPAAAVLKVSSSSSSSSSDQVFEIVVNPPTVETLSLPGFPMVGYPISPIVGLAFAELSSCRFRWLRKRVGQLQPQEAAAAVAAGGSWEDTGCYDMCYVPTDRDLGCRLKVECTPGAAAAAAGGGAAGGNGAEHAAAAAALQDGPAAAAVAAESDTIYGEVVTAETGPVQPGPPQSAAFIRQLSPGVPLPEPWWFRVMSYNILADQYAGTAYAQEVLFKYCPKELLDNNYRRQLVLEEILRYQPDICCLQEVDDKVYSEYLSPHLSRHGYTGHYTNKQGKVREGSAMFWRSGKWVAAAMQDIKLRDLFKLPLSDRHCQFTPMLESSPALTEALQKVTTIAQMVLLLPRNAAAGSSTDSCSNAAAAAAGPLLMINTHLFFHPYAPHIRSLHTAAILEEAAAALQCWQQQAQQQQQQQQHDLAAAAVVDPDQLRRLVDLPDPTVLFCGDLNSDLNDGVPGVIEMLQTGQLAADHWDWQMGATFRWGKEEEEYAQEEQQQQQQQDGNSPAACAQQQQIPNAGVQQQQQLPLEDGHDFDQGSSPRSAMTLHGIDVTIPFVLRSADDLATPYTNYTSGYKALLDYVWYDPQRLHVTRQLPVPAEQLLSSFIPSASFPSDHLAVVYDLAFKPRSPKSLDAAAAAAGTHINQQGISQISHPIDPDQAGLRNHDPGNFLLLPATEDHVTDAVTALRNDDVIAVPTDTLYGFAAAAGSDAAVRQLRNIKQRSAAAPLAVAVADVADVARYCVTDHLPDGLLRALLPGPVTVLLPLKPGASLAAAVLNPDSRFGSSDPAAVVNHGSTDPTAAASAAVVNPGSGDPAAVLNPGSSDPAAATAVVGIRVVPDEFVRRVCRELEGGIALTSANMSGKESSTCIQDFRELWRYCAAVFDSGPIPVTNNLGSTVIDLTRLRSSHQQQQQVEDIDEGQQQQQQRGGATSAGAAGGFRIVRAGVAAESVADLLMKAFGLKQL